MQFNTDKKKSSNGKNKTVTNKPHIDLNACKGHKNVNYFCVNDADTYTIHAITNATKTKPI